jgi:hypothetical protein
MATRSDNLELLNRLLENKEVRRNELAHLPIETKLQLIALMQRRANEIRRATGRPTRPEWPLEELEFRNNTRAGSASDPYREAAMEEIAFLLGKGRGLPPVRG